VFRSLLARLLSATFSTFKIMAAPKSNVKGTFVDSKGLPKAGAQVSFFPQDTPFAIGGDIVTGAVLTVTLSAAGKFGDVTDSAPYNVFYPLVQGRYRVVLSDADAFQIQVPGDGALYDIKDIAVNVNPSESLKAVNSAVDFISLVEETSTIDVSLRGDRYGAPSRFVCYGGGMPRITSASLYNLWTALANYVPLADPESGNICAIGIGNIDGSSPGALTSDASFVDGLTTDKFLYAVDTADWSASQIANILAHFGTSETYYKHSYDAYTDIFIIDSSSLQPDGNTSGSAQGLWLQAQLAASTAKYKIVVFQDSPKASKTGYSFPNMDWPFVAWGATLVIAAGPYFYERIDLGSGVWLIVNGAAQNTTASTDTFGTPISGSTVRLAFSGLLVLETTSYSLTAKFVKLDGSIGDSFEIVAPNTSKLYLNTNFEVGAGIRTGLGGYRADFGTADKQVLTGTDLWQTIQMGRVIRVPTDPTTIDFYYNPYLKECLFIVGDDPGVLKYYNKANDSVDVFGLASVHGGTLVQTDPPTLSPSNGSQSARCAITHPDPDVTILVSVNGGAFYELLDWATTPILFSGQSPWWVAAYAIKPGMVPPETPSAVVKASYLPMFPIGA
jgi:hypothetical protein